MRYDRAQNLDRHPNYIPGRRHGIRTSTTVGRLCSFAMVTVQSLRGCASTPPPRSAWSHRTNP
jgi:hypothetical protein